MSLPSGVKPMLSATLVNLEDAKSLTFPAYVSPKIDGIRCLTDASGAPYSRNGTLIRNGAIRELFARAGVPGHLDGELGLGHPGDPEFFGRTSGLCRRTYDNDFDVLDYHVFDSYKTGSYEERWINQNLQPSKDSRLRVIKLSQKKVSDEDNLKDWEDYFVSEKYEGIMVRCNLDGAYKYGRSSLKQGLLIKYKRFASDEMRITGFVQAMQNNNEAEENAFGNTKRSSAKEGKTPLEMVGVILGACDNFDGEVRLGTGIGFNHDLKKDMYNNPHKYIGRIVEFEYQAGSDYEKVRFGSYKGFRDDGI